MVSELKHIAMTKKMTEEATVYGAKVLSVHLFVCTQEKLFNRGFCHIKTVNDKITLWADEPFKLVRRTLSNREWKGVFTTEIINGNISKTKKNFSMKSLQESSALALAEAFLTNQPTDQFFIEGLLSVKVSQDLPPEEIYIQSPLLEYSIPDGVDNTDQEADQNQFIKDVETEFGRAQGYINNTEYYLEKGGAFEEGLPRHHKYRSVQESELFQFIEKAIDREEEVSNQILSQAFSIADLTEISNELNVLVDKAIMAKREGDLNQAFKYYDAFFHHNQTWFMLWYGVAKLLCLFREYRMAFACIKICTYIYPKMWGGRRYTSDHNLSYHYEQMYALAIKQEENESYLKTLGRPLNTVRMLNLSGKPDKNAPVFRFETINPQDLSKLQEVNSNNISKVEIINNLDSETPHKSFLKPKSSSLDIAPNLSKRSKRRSRRKNK